MERYYAAKEVAGILGLSDDMVRRIFANEPGVLNFAVFNKQSKSTGRNRLLRIPESVLCRVCEERTIRCAGLNLDAEFRKIQERYPLKANERTTRSEPSPVASPSTQRRKPVKWSAGYASIDPASEPNQVLSPVCIAESLSRNAGASINGPEAWTRTVTAAAGRCGWRFCAGTGRRLKRRLLDSANS
jgi:hypothetical protein